MGRRGGHPAPHGKVFPGAILARLRTVPSQSGYLCSAREDVWAFWDHFCTLDA